jgi:SH3-like domain-containing protein|tara:strand:- start:1257 stop:1697 length:441 start_codon:yes stop_codon:yes gene_type:complete
MQKIIIIILLFFFQNVAVAEQKNYFLMLKNSKVNVRYGPSFDYPVKFFYKKINLPIKVIDKKENFRRIIDHKKNSGWIHISQLRKANSLIVLEDKILFKNNSKFSKPIIILEKGRLVLIKKCISNWCNIKTDKYRGWVQTDNVWGI